jgi:hypothetical protein
MNGISASLAKVWGAELSFLRLFGGLRKAIHDLVSWYEFNQRW